MHTILVYQSLSIPLGTGGSWLYSTLHAGIVGLPFQAGQVGRSRQYRVNETTNISTRWLYQCRTTDQPAPGFEPLSLRLGVRHSNHSATAPRQRQQTSSFSRCQSCLPPYWSCCVVDNKLEQSLMVGISGV